MSEVLQATLIEDGDLNAPTSELHIIKAVPGSDIVSNIEGLKAWVTEQIETYAANEIKTEDDYAQAKRDRTSLRAMGTTIDNERKRIKTLYTAPLKAFEDSVKDVTAPINQLDVKMKEAIDTYDEQVKQAKSAIIRAHYEEFAPDIALPLEGQSAALVPYERVENPQWLNRSVTDKAACDALEEVVRDIAGHEATLNSLGLAHESEARAEFFQTLSVEAAIERDRQLTEQEEREAALRAERDRCEAEDAAERPAEATVEAPEAVGAPEDVPPESGPERPPEPTMTVRLRIEGITQMKLTRLMGWMRANDIHGRMVHEGGDAR